MKEQLWVLDFLRPELIFPDIPGICFCGDSDSSSNDSSSDDSGQPDDGEEESTTTDEEIKELIQTTGYDFDNDNGDGDNDNNNTPAEGTLNSDGTLIWSGGSWKTAYYDKLGDVFASQAERDESNQIITEIEDEARLTGETDDQGRIWGDDNSWHTLNSDEGQQALLDADPNILDIPKGTIVKDEFGDVLEGDVWDGNSWVSLSSTEGANIAGEIEVDGETLKWRGDKKGWMTDEQNKEYDARPDGQIHPRYDDLAWDKSTQTWKSYYTDLVGGVHFSQEAADQASIGVTRRGGTEVWTGNAFESIYTDAGAKAAGVLRGETVAGFDGTERSGIVFDGEKWVDVNSLQGASVLEQLSDGSKWQDDGVNMGWYTDEEWADLTSEGDASQLAELDIDGSLDQEEEKTDEEKIQELLDTPGEDSDPELDKEDIPPVITEPSDGPSELTDLSGPETDLPEEEEEEEVVEPPPDPDPELDNDTTTVGDLDDPGDVVNDTDDTKDTDPGGDPELDQEEEDDLPEYEGEEDEDDDAEVLTDQELEDMLDDVTPPDDDDDPPPNDDDDDDDKPPDLADPELNYATQLEAIDAAFADLLSDETFGKVEDDYLASFSDEMQTEYDAALRGIYDSFKRAGRITSSELAGEVGELDDQKSADLAKLGGDADTFAEGRRTRAKTRKSNIAKALGGLTTQADIDNFTFDVFGDDDYGTLAENPDFGDAPEFFKFFDKASPEEFRLNITRPYRRTGTYQPKTGSTNYSASNRNTSGRGSSRIV